MLGIALGSSLFNLNLSNLISFAEILQFLCLFSLLNISFYPNDLFNLFNAQELFNINFIPDSMISSLNCDMFIKDEGILGNIANHPSINSEILLCNIPSIVSLFIFPLILILLLHFAPKIIVNYIKESYKWNGTLNTILGTYLNTTLLVLVQLTVVIII